MQGHDGDVNVAEFGGELAADEARRHARRLCQRSAHLLTEGSDVKPFYRTSEFWGSVLAGVGALAAGVAGIVTGPVAVVAACASQAAYAISRGIAKSGGE
jgi:hypothetical protein